MTTGAYWDIRNPLKPYGYLDPQEVKNVPIDFSEWLDSEVTVYVSHEVDADPRLLITTLSNIGGVVIVQVSVPDASLIEEAEKVPMTLLVTAADGQKKSQTLFFKIKEL